MVCLWGGGSLGNFFTPSFFFVLFLGFLFVCFIYHCVLVVAAVTKYRPLDGLNKHLFLSVLKTGKPKIMVLVDWVSGEGLFPGLQRDTFLLCPQRVDRESGGLL